MKPIRLIAPARTAYMARLMIEAGADELYVGLRPPQLRQLSFDSRFQTIAGFPAHCTDVETLQAVVDHAKAHGLGVTFCANAAYVPRAGEAAYVEHVRLGVDLGVDAIAVGALQSIDLLRAAGIDTALTGGSALAPLNRGQVRLLQSLGVTRCTLPQHLSPREIEALAGEGVELIVQGNLGSGGIPGLCRLLESPLSDEIGDGTRTRYRATLPDGRVWDDVPFLDSATDCCLCGLGRLRAAGLSGIRLIGREAPNPVTLSAVVSLFKRWLELDAAGMSPSQRIETMEMEDVLWTMSWAPRFCQQQRCSYEPTPTVQSLRWQ